MSETQEFVSVKEKEFWEKKSLELTINGQILNSDLKSMVESKVRELNTKIDATYKVWMLDFNGNNKVSEAEKQKLVQQLKEVIKGFNDLIWRTNEQYIWRISENKQKIQWDIWGYFLDKNLFVEKSSWFASALRWYASMDPEMARTQKEKELSLN